MSRASIDIAIVNYRSANDTLQALARLANWPNGTIWLVDNSAHEPDMTAQTAALQQGGAVDNGQQPRFRKGLQSGVFPLNSRFLSAVESRRRDFNG